VAKLHSEYTSRKASISTAQANRPSFDPYAAGNVQSQQKSGYQQTPAFNSAYAARAPQQHNQAPSAPPQQYNHAPSAPTQQQYNQAAHAPTQQQYNQAPPTHPQQQYNQAPPTNQAIFVAAPRQALPAHQNKHSHNPFDDFTVDQPQRQHPPPPNYPPPAPPPYQQTTHATPLPWDSQPPAAPAPVERATDEYDELDIFLNTNPTPVTTTPPAPVQVRPITPEPAAFETKIINTDVSLDSSNSRQMSTAQQAYVKEVINKWQEHISYEQISTQLQKKLDSGTPPGMFGSFLVQSSKRAEVGMFSSLIFRISE
jgi:hypothetical protein